MREEKDAWTRGKICVDIARESRIVREAHERATNYCRIESLGPKVHNNILLIKKTYRSEKKKTKKV